MEAASSPRGGNSCGKCFGTSHRTDESLQHEGSDWRAGYVLWRILYQNIICLTCSLHFPKVICITFLAHGDLRVSSLSWLCLLAQLLRWNSIFLSQNTLNLFLCDTECTPNSAVGVLSFDSILCPYSEARMSRSLKYAFPMSQGLVSLASHAL